MGKIRNTELLGAGVVGQGDGLDEAYALARNTAARDGPTLVHPYDDERIIAGQGTGGLEILGENRDFDAVVVRSEEHTSELQSLMRSSYDGFCLKKKKATSVVVIQENEREQD